MPLPSTPLYSTLYYQFSRNPFTLAIFHRTMPDSSDKLGDNSNDETTVLWKDWAMCPCTSSWMFSRNLPEPVAIIAVKDLKTSAFVGKNNWGETGKQQPVLMSVSIALRDPFKSSSEVDNIAPDTIHYGRLKSAVNSTVAEFNQIAQTNIKESTPEKETTLGYLLQRLALTLHGQGGIEPKKVAASSEMRVMLPKASARGTGVSYTLSNIYNSLGGLDVWGYALRLQIHDVTVPTLIGLGPKERFARQNVVANVVMDRWQFCNDYYNDIEQVVVKTMEESSFGTIEALADQICQRLIRYIIRPIVIRHMPTILDNLPNGGLDRLKAVHRDPSMIEWSMVGVQEFFPQVRVKLEKLAIYDNTTPGVEMLVDSFPQERSWTALTDAWKGKEDLKMPPFPLPGSLDDWILGNFPNDVQTGGEIKVSEEAVASAAARGR